jgi:uncharacterized damage-inducible protein DinB
MDVADFRTLYDYNSWANRRVLEACAPLSAEQFTHNNGSSFPSVRDTLAHICGAEWIWLERWNGRVPTGGIPAASDYPDFETLEHRWTEIERDLLGFIASLKSDDVNRVVQFTSLAGIPFSQQLGHCLQHLANHSTYHRGQVTTMLRQLGAKPASTDLIMFYRERLAAKTGA